MLRLAGLAVAALALSPAGASAATITVGVTNDEINGDSDCSLREAVQAANTNGANTTGCADGEAGPAIDTIVLTPGQLYSHTIDPDGTPDDNADGDFDVLANIGGPVVIQGGSIATGTALIGGSGEDRVLQKLNAGSLTLVGVTVTDGNLDDPIAQGAGLSTTGGTLTVIDSIVFDNKSAQDAGGGIATLGDLTLEDSIVAENTAGESGGGAQVSGALSVDNSVVGSNLAGTEPAASAESGGGIRATGDSVTITNSTFNMNGARGNGGSGGGLALALSTSGSKTISDSTFTGNDAEQVGGAIYASFNADDAAFTIEDSRIEGNDAGPSENPSVFGGGISVPRGHLDLIGTVVRDNDATSDSGGATGGGLQLADDASAAIDDSLIAANHAISTGGASVRGGGVATDGGLLVRRTTIASNELDGDAAGDRGGGIYAGPNTGAVNAYNLTVHGNLALDAGSRGGGIHVQGASSFVNLTSSTVASNFAGTPVEPGDAVSVSQAGELATARNSIIDGPVLARVCDGSMVSGGYNITTDTSCGLTGTGDFQNAPPMLEPLAGNGGLAAGPPDDTEVVGTRALMAGSPAINHVPMADFPNPSCTGQTSAPLATDARGFPRPVGAACDAGAYELTKCFGTVVGDGGLVGTEGGDTLNGTNGDDVLFALAGGDTVKGKGGKDRICGSLGKDKLNGGDGKDKLDGGAQSDVCKGGPKHDKAKRCEKQGGIP
jgi:CSLREA domain-containing protein